MSIRVLKGMLVRKTSGYKFVGIVRSRFYTGARRERVVVEMVEYVDGKRLDTGLLHIYDPMQLEYYNDHINTDEGRVGHHHRPALSNEDKGA